MRYKTLILAVALLAPAVTTLPSCTYSQVLHHQEDGIASLNRTLSGVQDKASADAAAPAVRMYGRQLMADIRTIFANGRPSLIELLVLKNSYQNSSIRMQSKSCLSQFFRIYQNRFYDSAELRAAFMQMLLNGR